VDNIHLRNMWNKLTIQQAQEVDRILKQNAPPLDIEVELIAIINDMSIDEVDSLKWAEYTELRKSLDFLNKKPDGKAIPYVTIGDKRYRFIYDIRQMPFARYIEGKTFSVDFANNLHKIAASMSIQQKRNWYGRWVDQKYNAAKHSEYAEDLLQAPFEAVYSAAVFFYQVYRIWITASKDYLIEEQVKTGKTMEEAEKLVNDLCQYLDGSTQLNR